ncbi:MAG: hypothetical protein US50_C0017G0013 [Candidatus Nomurabacteria bacterium GW2011_GWB1_37_5]|uniref:Uncharacterized protein n=1 Tax=Candidatus Nomurabacteria bacterium GW2011_GWB1_37_5 TaxID=1618742 RepID=A0A0G0GZA5_9BACT|nr:MAG: hypothetical protein US50_C0017G0013 [Candidatus Nomurabacteria bacterium GW2011_GWB1_37_5]
MDISNEKISAIVSLFVAIVILSAGFSQWWSITYDGKMITKKWVKCLFVFCIVLLIFAGWLLFL